jgi:hypothetical protein
MATWGRHRRRVGLSLGGQRRTDGRVQGPTIVGLSFGVSMVHVVARKAEDLEALVASDRRVGGAAQLAVSPVAPLCLIFDRQRRRVGVLLSKLDDLIVGFLRVLGERLARLLFCRHRRRRCPRPALVLERRTRQIKFTSLKIKAELFKIWGVRVGRVGPTEIASLFFATWRRG